MELKQENYKSVQSLVATRQKELEKNGVDGQLAYRKAAAEVGALFTPPVTGSEITQFVTLNMSYAARSNGKPKANQQAPLPLNDKIIQAVEDAEWPIGARKSEKENMTTLLAQALDGIQPGEVRALVCNQEAGRKLQQRTHKVGEAVGAKFTSTYRNGKLYVKRTE